MISFTSIISNAKACSLVSKLQIALLFLILLPGLGISQSKLLEVSKLEVQTNPLSTILSNLEQEHNVFFAYSPETVPLNEIVSVPNKTLTVAELLKHVFIRFDIGFEEKNSKIILFSTEEVFIQISGIVRDAESKESLAGASVFVENGKYNTICNVDGFFSLSVPESDSITITSTSIAYKASTVRVEANGKNHILELTYDNYIWVTISSEQPLHSIVYNPDINGTKFSQEKINKSASMFGRSDILSTLRSLPSVSSGFEGQSGFNVRGAGFDQNLVMIDGIPVYEISHLGGISSIFMSESVKDMEFANSGIPARYGGRLSSVLNIRTKDGSQNDYERTFTVGVEGLSLHMNGPINKGKTSFSFSGRTSWFGQLSKPFVKQFNDITDYALQFSDYHGKLTHWFGPSNSISFSAYKGDDLFRTRRETQVPGFLGSASIVDFNSIQWGNGLASLNWKKSFGDHVYLNVRLGSYAYNYKSEGEYDYSLMTAIDTSTLFFGQEARSSIRDRLANLDFEIYTQKLGTIKLGAGYIDHRYRNAVREYDDFAGSAEPADEEQLESDEYYSYIEDRFSLNRNLNLHLGLRYSGFSTDSTLYMNLLPRLSLSYVTKSHTINFGASRMAQYNHLLTNPGPGLPSNLWVPSTRNIGPQTMDEYSIGYKFKSQNFFTSIAYFDRNYYNVTDYQFTSDIFYSLIDNENFNGILPRNENWKESVTSGNGKSFGVEFNIEKSFNKYKFNLGYTYSKSTREFTEINGGNAFDFRFDRRHDLNLLFEYKLTPRSDILVQFVYGTGHPYTLNIERREDIDNEEIFVPAARSNVRFNDFHHLDIQYRYFKHFDDMILEGRLGFYNVYNRFNPFYVFIFEDKSVLNPTIEDPRYKPIQVSIFPLIPQVSFTLNW